MEWDPLGERLAITFVEKEYGDPDGTELIAIYASTFKPTLDFIPRGFIRGPHTGKKAHILSWRPKFPRGALLTAVNTYCSFISHPF